MCSSYFQMLLIDLCFLFLDVLQLFSDVVDRPLGKEAGLLPLSHLHWGRPHCICFHWGPLIFLKLLFSLIFIISYHVQFITIIWIFECRTRLPRMVWSTWRRTRSPPALASFSFTPLNFSPHVSGECKDDDGDFDVEWLNDFMLNVSTKTSFFRHCRKPLNWDFCDQLSHAAALNYNWFSRSSGIGLCSLMARWVNSPPEKSLKVDPLPQTGRSLLPTAWALGGGNLRPGGKHRETQLIINLTPGSNVHPWWVCNLEWSPHHRIPTRNIGGRSARGDLK